MVRCSSSTAAGSGDGRRPMRSPNATGGSARRDAATAVSTYQRKKSRTACPSAPIPFPADVVLQHARFATGTLLEIQKRTLDLMARQGAEATRLAQEAIGAAGSAGQQSIADGLQLVRTSAERVQVALSAAFRAV